MNLANYLLIDASSPTAVVVAQLDAGGCRWRAFEEEQSAALEGIFSAAERVCPGFKPSGFLFCEGPGSILGIRIAAVAIRGSNALANPRPILAFQSLHLAAILIVRAFPQERDFFVIAESRMNAWNVLEIESGKPKEPFRELKTPELTSIASKKVFVLPQRRPLPPPIACIPINPASLLRHDPAVFAENPTLLHTCEFPDAINTASASGYAKWTPERHR